MIIVMMINLVELNRNWGGSSPIDPSTTDDSVPHFQFELECFHGNRVDWGDRWRANSERRAQIIESKLIISSSPWSGGDLGRKQLGKMARKCNKRKETMRNHQRIPVPFPSPLFRSHWIESQVSTSQNQPRSNRIQLHLIAYWMQMWTFPWNWRIDGKVDGLAVSMDRRRRRPWLVSKRRRSLLCCCCCGWPLIIDWNRFSHTHWNGSTSTNWLEMRNRLRRVSQWAAVWVHLVFCVLFGLVCFFYSFQFNYLFWIQLIQYLDSFGFNSIVWESVRKEKDAPKAEFWTGWDERERERERGIWWRSGSQRHLAVARTTTMPSPEPRPRFLLISPRHLHGASSKCQRRIFVVLFYFVRLVELQLDDIKDRKGQAG